MLAELVGVVGEGSIDDDDDDSVISVDVDADAADDDDDDDDDDGVGAVVSSDLPVRSRQEIKGS